MVNGKNDEEVRVFPSSLPLSSFRRRSESEMG